MSRLTISDRVSLVLLGWQSECAKLAATNLVHSYSPPETYLDLPGTLESCVDLGRAELRRHLAAVRGDDESTSERQPVAKFLVNCSGGCGTLVVSDGLCGPCLVKDERAAFARGERIHGMLSELREGWRVTLRSDENGWNLEVVSKPPYRGFGDRLPSQHRYVGADLPKLVARAWAGEPGDE